MKSIDLTPVQQAIDALGSYKIAMRCGVKGPSVCKWRRVGRLPRTEWTGETDYATIISQMSDGRWTREELLTIKIDAFIDATPIIPPAEPYKCSSPEVSQT